VELDEPDISEFFAIHENIDLPLRRAMGVIDLISTSPDSDDCVKTAADGAGDWLRQAKKAVDRLHKWWVRNRGDC
jgi:hypothetical protein